jgi:hypothetical protein
MKQKANKLGVDLLLIDTGVSDYLKDCLRHETNIADTGTRIFMTVLAFLMQHHRTALYPILSSRMSTMTF